MQLLLCQWVLQEMQEVLQAMLQETLHVLLALLAQMYLAMMRHLRQEVKINDSQIALQPLAGLVVADI